MVKVIYNDQLVYKEVIWAFFGISLWKDNLALNKPCVFICNKKEWINFKSHMSKYHIRLSLQNLIKCH